MKRYVTFSSWFGESIHCERILTCGPQFFHFSFSAIKKSFPMFKSSTSRPLCRNVLWFCLILSGPCFFRKYSTFSTPFSFHPLSPFDSKDFYRYFNIFFFFYRFLRCSALATPPKEPPAKILHMTYKIFQTDTKLINLLLQSHGLTEVSYKLLLATSLCE